MHTPLPCSSNFMSVQSMVAMNARIRGIRRIVDITACMFVREGYIVYRVTVRGIVYVF